MKYVLYFLHIISLFVFSIPLFSQTTYWLPVKGIPDTSYILSLHVTQDGTIFAGTYEAEVYRSLDAGSTWESNVRYFLAYSIASFDQTIFLGDLNFYHPIPETYFGRSTDNGDHWSIGYPLASGNIRTILPISSTTVLIATYESVFKSTNAGSDFDSSCSGLGSTHIRVLAQDSSGNIFAGSRDDGIFLSIDEGANWWSLPTVNIIGSMINDIAIIGSQYYFACTETSGVFRSTDFGTGWQPSNSGITTRRTYSLAISKDSTIYVATNQGVFKSTDFGFSWESFSQGLPPASTITRVASSPSGTLFAGTNNRGLYKTQQLPVYQKGWNLVSLPLTVTDNTVSSLLPGSSSNAFTYDSTYTQQTNLIKGHGYWVKFDSTTPALYTGSLINEDTINVKKGWNLIGSISAPVSIDSLINTPAEMHLSGFFQFEPGTGYSPITTITPGYAYWVKSDMDGQVIISSNH